MSLLSVLLSVPATSKTPLTDRWAHRYVYHPHRRYASQFQESYQKLQIELDRRAAGKVAAVDTFWAKPNESQSQSDDQKEKQQPPTPTSAAAAAATSSSSTESASSASDDVALEDAVVTDSVERPKIKIYSDLQFLHGRVNPALFELVPTREEAEVLWFAHLDFKGNIDY
jgi:hypothetical protein